MEDKNLLYYFNYALKIILVILTVYCMFVAYQFFTWFSDNSEGLDTVIEQCNLYALSDREYDYCCKQHSVYNKGEIVCDE
jgi:hypothetical protein